MGIGVDRFPDKYKGRFDICTGSGCFLPNHVPYTAFDDCHSTLKTNGYFVTAVRKVLWDKGEKHGYRDQIDRMIKEGKFKLIKTIEFSRGMKDGIDLFAEQ